MEIEDIRKELNHLLENVVEHSQDFSDGRPIPSLEVSFVLAKINKMQQALIILKHLLEEQENTSKRVKHVEKEVSEIKQVEVEEKEETMQETSLEIEVQEKTNLENSLEQLPISKLVDALTLNDRYLYANELFDKDMEAFNELVKSIDNSSTINEANGLLSSFEWDKENEHVLSFTLLVERRFS